MAQLTIAAGKSGSRKSGNGLQKTGANRIVPAAGAASERNTADAIPCGTCRGLRRTTARRIIAEYAAQLLRFAVAASESTTTGAPATRARHSSA